MSFRVVKWSLVIRWLDTIAFCLGSVFILLITPPYGFWKAVSIVGMIVAIRTLSFIRGFEEGYRDVDEE